MPPARNGKWRRCPWCGRPTFGKRGVCQDDRWLELFHGKGFSERYRPGELEPEDILDETAGRWLPRHNGILEWVPDEREAG